MHHKLQKLNSYSPKFHISVLDMMMDCSLVLMVTQDPWVKVEQEWVALLPGPPRPPQARRPDWVWTYLHIRAEGIKLFLDFHHFACFIQCTYVCRFRKSLYGISSFTQKSENPLQKVSNLL